ncbi:hypothetical protein [Galbibacter sp. PAP.153]|uniref:hypothetical protein n=1 Tax=Galbibacter sp. PAP.153 TaxID=3104623 RepID=UPI00300B6227
MKKSIVLSIAFLLIGYVGSSQIRNNNVRDNVGWQKIGEVKANYGNDHDAINVDGSFNDFRILKFNVGNADVNMERMEITYDSGAKENVPLRLEIRKGEESRNINLPGGKRRVHKIEFWYNTKGMFSGKARITVYGKR